MAAIQNNASTEREYAVFHCLLYLYKFYPFQSLELLKNLPKYLDIHVASNHKSYWKPQNEPSTNTPSIYERNAWVEEKHVYLN